MARTSRKATTSARNKNAKRSSECGKSGCKNCSK